MRKKTDVLPSPTAPAQRRFPRRCLLLLLSAAVLPASAANIDTYWQYADGETPPNPNGSWSDANRWSGGVPADLLPTDTNRTFFDISSGAESNVTVEDGYSGGFNSFYIYDGKRLNLLFGSGSSLAGAGLQVGNNDKATHLNMEGTGGNSSMSFSFINIGSGATGTGNTVTVQGSGLTVSASATTTVGRTGNAHRMIVSNGGAFNGAALVVSGTQTTVSGVGNNHQFIVNGAGSVATFNGGSSGTLGLIVGARPTTGLTASTLQSGNRILVEDGGHLVLDAVGAAATKDVLVGYAHYRTNNWIDISGTGSLLEVKGNARTRIGYDGDSTYNNRIVVRDGGAFRTDSAIEIYNSSSTAANRRNILSVENGGTLATSNAIDNNGGLVRLAEGGSIVGETLAGSLANATLNINGTGRLEAEGTGLGKSLTVNIGNSASLQAVFAVGLAGRTSASSILIDSTFNMNDGSLLEVAIFGSNEMDMIILGDDAAFSIGNDVGLLISTVGYTLQGGESFQLFSGNLGAISGSFNETLLNLPTLSDGLFWDLGDFNAAGDWVLTVGGAIPEPSQVALTMGVLAILVLGVTRRARARRTAAR